MAAETSDSVVRKRGCTDVVCLFLFGGMFVAMAYIGYLGVSLGDPYRLVFGVDSWGNTCNRDNDAIENSTLPAENLEGVDNLYYFDFSNPVTSVKICVDECPNATLLTPADLEAHANETGTRLCRYDFEPEDYIDDDDICPSGVLPSFSILNRCVPVAAVDAATSVIMGGVSGALNALQAQCDSAGDFYERAAGDIERAWKEILYICAMAFGMALLLTFLMRWLAKLIIWMMVVICALVSLAGTAFCWYNWNTIRTDLNELPEDDRVDEDKERLKWWLIYAGSATVITVIVWLILLVMRKRIALVAQLFHEAGRALGAMPLLLFQPVWTLLSLLGTCSILFLMALYIQTADLPTVDVSSNFVTFELDDLVSKLRWLFLLGALWIIQFILACHQMVIAGAVVIWYFSRDKSKIGFPICKSTQRVIRYHLGSLAFGSLLVALIQMARIILAYLEKKTRNVSSPVMKFVFRCVQCCLWCFEKFVKFINRNAYIMIAIQGTNFCSSARDAFCLLLRNVLRVAAVNTAGTFCLFLGKLGVTAATVILGLQLIQTKIDICYVWLPLSIGAIFAFFISSTFLSVYAMAVDTVLLCFCKDIEENDGVTKPFFMSKGLMEYVKKTNSEAAKKDKVASNKTSPVSKTEESEF